MAIEEGGLLVMAGTSEEVIVPEGIPRAVQTHEENREGQLRIGLPG